jgi:hypothetical protein
MYARAPEPGSCSPTAPSPRTSGSGSAAGNAAVAFMRLGNAEDAKAASEQLGSEHRFVLSQLTETVGRSVTDTTASAYTSTTGSVSSAATSRSVSEGSSRSTGHGRSDGSSLLPSRATFSRSVQDSDSRSTGESDSVSTGISSSTAWGLTTSQATGDSESVALALQRSREFLVEQHELQQLPGERDDHHVRGSGRAPGGAGRRQSRHWRAQRGHPADAGGVPQQAGRDPGSAGRREPLGAIRIRGTGIRRRRRWPGGPGELAFGRQPAFAQPRAATAAS